MPLTKLDVPSRGRCRKLEPIIHEIPHAWWYRPTPGSQWRICTEEPTTQGGPSLGEVVPAYTLGQMLEWARRKAQGPGPSLDWIGRATTEHPAWQVVLYPKRRKGAVTIGLHRLASNAVADAIIAATRRRGV